MSYIFQSSDFSDFIVSGNPEGTEDFSPSSVDPGHICLLTPKGEINYKEYSIKEDLTILEGCYQLHEPVTIYGQGHSHLLEMHFNLTNEEIHYENKALKRQVAPALSGNITYLSAEENKAKIAFNGGLAYQTFDVHFPFSFFSAYEGESKSMDTFLTKLHKSTSNTLSPKDVKVNPKIYSTIQAIKKCAFEGLTKRIFLESKIYELVAFVHEISVGSEVSLRLTSSDEERIRYAATLIRENLNKPFTIVELARAVGINQNKLKSGFKLVFGTTVFSYLQETRMQIARELLLETDLSIQHIGRLSGYNSMSNFSIAFKQIHGYSPKMLRSKA
jgi:AraC-like DNA-binding protein